jgi:hypothetical protein
MMASRHGHAACARRFEDGVAALDDDLDEGFDLGKVSGEFEHDRLKGEIDDAGAPTSAMPAIRLSSSIHSSKSLPLLR